MPRRPRLPTLRDLITALRADAKKQPQRRLPGPLQPGHEVSNAIEHRLMLEVAHHHAPHLWEEPNDE